MPNELITKLALVAVAVAAFSAWLYNWHYAPMDELKESKRIILEKDRNITTIQGEKKADVFESRHKAIKETMIKREEKQDEELNLSIGFHTTIFD